MVFSSRDEGDAGRHVEDYDIYGRDTATVGRARSGLAGLIPAGPQQQQDADTWHPRLLGAQIASLARRRRARLESPRVLDAREIGAARGWGETGATEKDHHHPSLACERGGHVGAGRGLLFEC